MLSKSVTFPYIHMSELEFVNFDYFDKFDLNFKTRLIRQVFHCRWRDMFSWNWKEKSVDEQILGFRGKSHKSFYFDVSSVSVAIFGLSFFSDF